MLINLSMYLLQCALFLEALIHTKCYIFLAIVYLTILALCLCKNVDFIYFLFDRDGRLTVQNEDARLRVIETIANETSVMF